MKNNHKVIERIIARKNGKNDDYRLGLIVEGGGMRGVFGGGVMVGLESLGLTDAFDYIYGSSSGSCSAAYLLSGQTREGVSIYWEDLPWFRFIKPWKLHNVMDLDLLFDTVMRKTKRLNTSRIKKADTTLRVFISDCETGEGLSYSNRDDVDMVKLIKASCALPGFYNKPIEIKGTNHLDGRIGKAIPIEDALTDGCTDILVVTTVPEYYRRKLWFEFKTYIENVLTIPLGPVFRKAFRARQEAYNDSLDIVFGVKPIHRKVNIYTIAPDYNFSTIEIRPKVLMEVAEHGIYKLKQAFLTEKL